MTPTIGEPGAESAAAADAAAPAPSSTIIECNGCGHRLRLPDGFPEGGGFCCAHCGLWMRNVEAARNFRWASFDAFTRKWGASKVNLIGGALGSIIWLPILGIVAAVAGTFDALQFTLLAVPYLVMIGILMLRRGRTPAALWVGFLWVGLGLYLIYVTLLEQWFAGSLLTGTAAATDPTGAAAGFGSLLLFGIVAVVAGTFSTAGYLIGRSKVPAISGDPPQI